MGLLIWLIDLTFTVYLWVIIVQVAISWLVAFDVINSSNPSAQRLMALLHDLTDPVYRRLRQFIPPIGGIDITPLIVMLGLSFIKNALIGLLI